MKSALIFLLFLSGCIDRDPCAGVKGTCLGLHVTGSGQVDQLRVQLDGVAHLDAATPSAPGVAHDLPVTTAIFLPSVSGRLDVSIFGLLASVAIGEARATVMIRPSQHLLLELALGQSGDDLALSQDLTGRDLASSDLASSDLASPDLASFDQSLSTDDLTGEDLTPPGDLTGTGPRRVFVLSARSPVLGTLASLDSECSSDAHTAGLGNHYLAIISYPGMNAGDRITLGQGRNVDVPSGRQVATDSTFFTVSHLSGIDELADGTPVTGCVFTAFSATGSSDVAAGNGDCAGWTSTSGTDVAYDGDVSATDFGWCFSTVDNCNAVSCHIYCIEQ